MPDPSAAPATPDSAGTPADAPVAKREIFGWAMFDFANSSYTTVIITLAFGIYFTKVVAGGSANADSLWGTGIFLTNLVVLLLSPLVGAFADESGRKKAFLFATYALCVAGTAGLYFAVPGSVPLALGLLVVSFIAFSFGENLAGAFLPEISTPRNIGRISALGWGIGYFGGLASILLVKGLGFLDGLDWEAARLLAPENAEVYHRFRLTWPATALFFLLAGLPTFLFLTERAPRPAHAGLSTYLHHGFERLGNTVRSIRHFRELSRFLAVFVLFHAGLTSVIAFAGIVYERTFGFSAAELVGLFLVIQVFSAAGALAFGWVQDKIGGKRAIQISLVVWVVTCVLLFSAESRWLQWILALVAGTGIGSLQSAARAMVGLFSPRGKSGEFFGFWGLAAKSAYLLGPLVFGIISSSSGSQRVAMLSTAGFFLAGLVGMAFIDERRGHAEAEAWERQMAAAGASGGDLREP